MIDVFPEPKTHQAQIPPGLRPVPPDAAPPRRLQAWSTNSKAASHNTPTPPGPKHAMSTPDASAGAAHDRADTSGTSHASAAVGDTTTTSTLNPASDGDRSGLPVPATSQAAPLSPNGSAPVNVSSLPQEITSPHQLTDWVDAALNRLEAQFTSLNRQNESRSQEMSERIDDLEMSITNLINGVTAPPRPARSASSQPSP